ncbi:MAG: hypothetical protein AAF298_30210 [Cyanobacteria bacterium P01_A01_bin.40]
MEAEFSDALKKLHTQTLVKRRSRKIKASWILKPHTAIFLGIRVFSGILRMLLRRE